MKLFEDILYDLSFFPVNERINKGNEFIESKIREWYSPFYAKLCINHPSIQNSRKILEKYFERYRNYLDDDFITSFQKKNTISHLAELLSFKILSDNNFSFKNTKTKKNKFPDIETIVWELFEVTTIEIDEEKYFWAGNVEVIDGIEIVTYPFKSRLLKDKDWEECLRFTSKIFTKNSDFIKKWLHWNLIIYSHSFTVSPERILNKVIYWNYLQACTQKWQWSYVWFDDFEKKSHIKVSPISFNPSLVSNIKSILFIGDSPNQALSKICDKDTLNYVFWKNPKYNPDFNIKIN